MEKITVPFISGDGVGAEVTPSMQAVVNAAVRKSYGDRRGIEWKEVLAGERAFHETGSWLPDETICLSYTTDAADERTSVDLGSRRLNKQEHTDSISTRLVHQ